MEKIELLEKLVEVQEMHIELMNDYNNLQCSYKDLEEIKNKRIQDLNAQIAQQKIEYTNLIDINDALTEKVVELKKQVEELQNLIPIELVDKEQENQ